MKKIFFCLHILVASKRCLSTPQYDYEDNIAMESGRPKSFEQFSQFVPQSFSGFLHRAGELLGDTDYGAKIQADTSEERQRSGQERATNPREISSRKVQSMKQDELKFRSQNVSASEDVFPGLTLHPNVVQSFLGGKNVDDVQDELKNLLFGDEDTRRAGNSTLKDSDDFFGKEDDRDYEDILDELLYNYEEASDVGDRRSQEEDPEAPIAAELRQRPFRSGVRRRRPFRGRVTSASQGRPSVVRPKPPPRDFRDPGLHKIPGRIQAVPDRFPARPGPNSIAAAVDCDFYTDDLCLGVKQYPIKEISRLLGANRRLSEDMIVDVTEQSADDLIDGVSSNQELTYDYSHYFGTRRMEDPAEAHKHRDFAEDGGFLCPSEIKYAKPKRGKTAQGVWKDIVNVDDYTQTLRMEKCLKPGGTCSYVSHHYKSQCSQVYNYHRLLSWDKGRGLHMDIYKVPTCCSCHIMGYSYVYPPLKKADQSPAPALHRPPPPPTNLHSAPAPAPGPAPGSFVDFGADFNSGPGFGSGSGAPTFSIPQRDPVPAPAPSRPPPPPQLTPDTRPSRPAPGGADFDNFIPDFDPQEELAAFMNSIGDDFKDFNFERDQPRPVRGNQRPRPGSSRPVVGGFQPISGGLAPPPPRRGTRRQQDGSRRGHYSSIRRGDGFGPHGEPGFGEDETFEDPLHKYESIPLEFDDTNFVKKKLNTKSSESEDSDSHTSVNYAYHPIIDFFNQS